MQKKILACISAMLPAIFIQAQTPIRVDKGFGDPNETTICINKVNPNQLVGASNIDYVYQSENGGKTWSEYKVTTPLGIYGDPVLLSSDYGRIFFTHLSRNPEKSYPNWFDKIVVQTSDNAGIDFNDGASVGYSPTKMQDKPWLNIDNHQTSPFKNRVFVSWTQFDVYNSADPNHKSNIKVAYSTDSGATFSQAKTISDISGGCLDDDNSTEGATTASLPDGTVCAVWSAFGKIWFDKSTDGGKTWGTDRILAEQVEGWEMEINQIYRSNGMPFLACDGSGGPNNGRLYLFYGDKKHGDADEWLMWSDDAGKTWTAPQRVNTDAIGNGRDQFMGHFILDQKTGHWYSVFYDRRHADGDKGLDITLAWSSGDTIYNQRLTPNTFPSPGKNKFFGDYIGVDAWGDFIVPLWTEYRGDLQLYTLPINRADLKPTSAAYQPLMVSLKGKQLHVNYKHGVQGYIVVEVKKCFFFTSKKRIEIQKEGSGNYHYTLKKKKAHILVNLHVPHTTFTEQTEFSVKKSKP